MRAALTLIAALTCGGCSLDVCREHPPALELEITLNEDLGVTVSNLEVRLEYAGQRFIRDFEVAGALDDGMTSIGVDLDPPPVESIRGYVEVRGRVAPDPRSEVVAFDDEGFTLTPDGCNLVPISLDEPDDD